MQPLTDRVLIEVEGPREKSASGILIQEDWKTLPPIGVVKAVGPDAKLVKIGDKVVFERYASVIMEDKNMRLCQERHILATLNEA